jgi:hypothetical protein
MVDSYALRVERGQGPTQPARLPYSFPPVGRPPQNAQLWNRSIIWFVTAGIFMPYTIGSTGKYPIALLFLPAIVIFFTQVATGRRRIMLSDFLAWTMAGWMIVLDVGRSGQLFGSGVDEALGFLGSYMIARSFMFGTASIQDVTRALKTIAIALIALGLLDTLSGRFFINELTADIFEGPKIRLIRGDAHFHRSLFGIDLIRATSTFDHPILYGTFCSIMGMICLYTEPTLVRRIFYVGLCFAGCLLSMSSGPLSALIIAISVYGYDLIWRQYSGRWQVLRWKVLWTVLAGQFCLLFIFVKNPFGWLIEHLTFDPSSGYFRLLIWQLASAEIARHPLTGDPSAAAASDVLSGTVDSIWLVLSLNYGLALVAFLLLLSLATCVRAAPKVAQADVSTKHMCTAFSLVVTMFVFIGLTAHFWNAVWLFWGLCIGIRTSLKECYGSPQKGRNTSAQLYPSAVISMR